MSTTRLSLATLGRLPPAVARPAYDISGQNIGIVHLGIGAFHRAHQAVYVDDCMAAGERDWGILGASLRSTQTREALAPQDGLYTVIVRSSGEECARVVGSVRGLLAGAQDMPRLLDAMSSPSVRIVSLTVTEKGYCHDPALGVLSEHPDIRHDLEHRHTPVSAPGIIVEALRRRRAAKLPPFTVLCCDNLPDNGKTTRSVVTQLAALQDADLALYIADEVFFPSTMVDRIVPASTDRDRSFVESLGFRDEWPISTEPFTQWVVEDHFVAGRPRLEHVGVELVPDVAPYETIKLRLLNGAHSSLAYLGYLAGYETIDQVMADADFVRFVRRLMDEEITPTVVAPLGFDLDAYKDSLIARFRNTALHHRTWQIAMDGSQKLPQRLLGTARARLAAGASIDRIALAIAGWMRYVSGTDEQGRPIDVRDPMAARLSDICSRHDIRSGEFVREIFGLTQIFGTDLPAHPDFYPAVRAALDLLLAQGARRSVEQMQ